MGSENWRAIPGIIWLNRAENVEVGAPELRDGAVGLQVDGQAAHPVGACCDPPRVVLNRCKCPFQIQPDRQVSTAWVGFKRVQEVTVRTRPV